MFVVCMQEAVKVSLSYDSFMWLFNSVLILVLNGIQDKSNSLAQHLWNSTRFTVKLITSARFGTKVTVSMTIAVDLPYIVSRAKINEDLKPQV